MRARIETKNGRIRSMIHDVLQIRTSLLVTLVCCMMIVLVADSRRVDAQEIVTVQDILADPGLFHLRQITLRGTVRNVQSLDPYEIPAGSTCYGGYLFTLEDDTASLPVAVPGLCGVPMVKDPEVEDGARVTVDATVQAPSHGGYALSFRGGKIAMDQEGIVQAIANRITPLVE